MHPYFISRLMASTSFSSSPPQPLMSRFAPAFTALALAALCLPLLLCQTRQRVDVHVILVRFVENSRRLSGSSGSSGSGAGVAVVSAAAIAPP